MEIQAAAPPRAPAAPPLPAAAPLPEPLPTKLERLHAEALDALRLVMTKAVESFTAPAPNPAGSDEAPQSPADHARTVTQRMRLALTAARDLLRYTTDGTTQPPSADSAGDRTFGSGAHESRKSPSDGQHHSNPSSGGRMRVPCDAQQSGAEPEVNQRDAQDRIHTSPAPPCSPSLIAHTSVSLLSKAGAAPIPGQPNPPPPESPAPTPKEDEAAQGPEKPAHLTETECYYYRAAHFDNKPISVEVYNRMLEWHRYAQATGTPHPINITLDNLRRIKPEGLPDPDP